MSTMTMDLKNGNRLFKILLTLSFLFFALLGYTAYMMGPRQASEVPLKPCKRCTIACPCPRLSGAIRCGCPE